MDWDWSWYEGWGPAFEGWGGGGCRFSPYGCKGKGKSKAKAKPKEDTGLVNSTHINGTKEVMEGGINFKTLLQEHVSKRVHRPIAQGDIVYSCQRVRNGRVATISLPCLGVDEEGGEEHKYDGDVPATDEKKAGQAAASKALESLFPEVFLAALEAYDAGVKACKEAANAVSTTEVAATEADTAAASGSSAAMELGEDPKSALNNRVQLVMNRPVASGDIDYDTKWSWDLNTYVCRLKLMGVDGGEIVYESEATNCTERKHAERDAARKALEANKSKFDDAIAEREKQKERQKEREIQKKGKGKGSTSRSSGSVPASSSRARSSSGGSHSRSAAPAPALPAPGYGPYGFPPPAAPGYGPPPAYGYPPPPAYGYGAPPPGYGMPPPGMPHPGMPHPGMPPPGYGPPPPGYGAPPPGYGSAYGALGYGR